MIYKKEILGINITPPGFPKMYEIHWRDSHAELPMPSFNPEPVEVQWSEWDDHVYVSNNKPL